MCLLEQGSISLRIKGPTVSVKYAPFDDTLCRPVQHTLKEFLPSSAPRPMCVVAHAYCLADGLRRSEIGTSSSDLGYLKNTRQAERLVDSH